MPFHPEKISREHVLKAAAIIDKNSGVIIPSTKFDVLIDNKPYPPKEVMRYAHEVMNGEHIWPYSGGTPTNKWLKNLGFSIVDKYAGKPDVIGQLIARYKEQLHQNSLANELYKFQLIQRFQDSWDIDALNFKEMVRKLDFSNLLYPLAKSSLDRMTAAYPGEVRAAFAYLYDERLSIEERLPGFLNRINAIHDKIKEKPEHNSWHDERTAATYLAFRYPDKYFIYKHSFYQPLCELLEVKPAPAGKKYLHYLELAADIRDNYVITDSELLNAVATLKDESCYPDPNSTILTQDILYTTLDQNVNDPQQATLVRRIQQLGDPGAVELYFDHLQQLFNECDISEDNKQVYCTTRKDAKRIAFTFGQRYIHQIDRTGEGLRMGFILTKADARKYTKTVNMRKGIFGGSHPMSWIELTFREGEIGNFDFRSLINDCVTALAEEKSRGSQFSFQNGNHKKAHNPLIYKMAVDKDYRNEIMARAFNKPLPPIGPKPIMPGRSVLLPRHPKNRILYGPPGTGKTYATIELAATISSGRTYSSHAESKKVFDELRATGQIEFITFHQNYSYEDFIVGIKPQLNGEALGFQRHEGIFYRICKKAEENYTQHKSGQTFLDPSFEEVVEEFLEPLEAGKEIKLATLGKNYVFHITSNNGKNLSFRKKSGGTGHTLSLTTLKELFENKREYNEHGLWVYYRPIVNRLHEIAKGMRREVGKVPLKLYVLIIDEINRANISKVFGELITLLEEDKRIGEPNELRLGLPNGESSFGVPPNLYLIGTMNTADKSIAHIDIALRRRFEFEGKYPDPSLLPEKFKAVLTALNEGIMSYKRSPDFLIGHAYFMGEEETALPRILRNKVLPLLNEYFIGRNDIIKEILNKAGVDSTINPYSQQIDVLDGVS